MASEFETLLLKMDAGFGKVYTKIDGVKDEFTKHLPICRDRFAEIDKQIAIKAALNCEAEKRDYWKYIIRTAIVIITGGMMGMLWKLFMSNIKIIG